MTVTDQLFLDGSRSAKVMMSSKYSCTDSSEVHRPHSAYEVGCDKPILEYTEVTEVSCVSVLTC